MQFKITTDYAIRTLEYLASQSGVIPSKEVAEKMGIPGKYLINLGAKLKEAGLLQTHQGKHGGYTLAKPAIDIRIYDILCAMGDTIKINRCLYDDQYCSSKSATNCRMRHFYSQIQEQLEDYFKSLTLEDLQGNVLKQTNSDLEMVYKNRERRERAEEWKHGGNISDE